MNKYVTFIIITIIFLLSCIILIQLLDQRKEIKSHSVLEKGEIIQKQQQREGFVYSKGSDESNIMADQIVKQIKNQTSPNPLTNQNNGLTLNQLSIFSSWNTACSGNFVSTDQITNVLASGCRMVHFTISNFNNQPMIFGNFTDTSGNSNSILLYDALTTCMHNAFNFLINVNTSSGKQDLQLNNYTDPLIVMLSFKYFKRENVVNYNLTASTNEKYSQTVPNPTYSNNFFKKCAKIVKNVFNNRLYLKNDNAIPLDKKITKNQINNQIIIITDITGLNQDQIDTFQKSKLKNYSNLVSGLNSNLQMLPFDTSETKTNKSSLFNLAVPINNQNPLRNEFTNFSFKQNCQFVPVVFYSSNITNLYTNIFNTIMQFFQDYGSAFVSFQTIDNEILNPNTTPVVI